MALLLPRHVCHEAAHQWLASHHAEGWATCPLTINGCVRVVSGEAISAATRTPGEIAGKLRGFCQSPHHHFWPDDVSLLDDQRFNTTLLVGPKQITDAYLLGLVVKHRGRLVTFDQNIATRVAIGAEARHLCLLAAALGRA